MQCQGKMLFKAGSLKIGDPCPEEAIGEVRFAGVTLYVCPTHRTVMCTELIDKGVKWTFDYFAGGLLDGQHGSNNPDRADASGSEVRRDPVYTDPEPTF